MPLVEEVLEMSLTTGGGGGSSWLLPSLLEEPEAGVKFQDLCVFHSQVEEYFSCVLSRYLLRIESHKVLFRCPKMFHVYLFRFYSHHHLA